MKIIAGGGFFRRALRLPLKLRAPPGGLRAGGVPPPGHADTPEQSLSLRCLSPLWRSTPCCTAEGFLSSPPPLPVCSATRHTHTQVADLSRRFKDRSAPDALCAPEPAAAVPGDGFVVSVRSLWQARLPPDTRRGHAVDEEGPRARSRSRLGRPPRVRPSLPPDRLSTRTETWISRPTRRALSMHNNAHLSRRDAIPAPCAVLRPWAVFRGGRGEGIERQPRRRCAVHVLRNR